MKTEDALSVFETVNVVSLQPGDVVLFRCPNRLGQNQHAAALDMLNEVFPDHESVILDNGQDIAVLRPEPGLWARIFSRKAA
ncbi:MAG: hypothetical protein Q7T25_14175 [Sideroxyarcus sp.]|nr:hypothetical protein [Sideroxyarcus sp.]